MEQMRLVEEAEGGEGSEQSDELQFSAGKRLHLAHDEPSLLAGQKLGLKNGLPWFFDAEDRVMMLRGINLSGSVKLPATPFQPSHVLEGFYEMRNDVSFVGRPFPLDQADEHFARLHRWGFNFLRFNVTWEALEHQGPGQYDDEYIEYVIEILKKAEQYNFLVCIDPHQDVWSRFCGGSGAPAWTLEAAGFDVERLHASKACVLHSEDPAVTARQPMLWVTNYQKLAAATMFTLFFGGRVFAPELTAVCRLPGGPHEGEEMSLQDFLQRHFAEALSRLARRVVAAGLGSTVVGYGSLNEPSGGYLGTPHLHPEEGAGSRQELRLGLAPTPFEGMLLGEGRGAAGVAVWGLRRGLAPGRTGREDVPPGPRAWREGKGCVWAQHGVWDPESGRLLRPNYFAHHPQTFREIDWQRDCWYPFAKWLGAKLQRAHPGSWLFMEPAVGSALPKIAKKDQLKDVVLAPHWYDGVTLVSRRWRKNWNVNYLALQRGEISTLRAIGRPKKVFTEMLKMTKTDNKKFWPVPSIIGEVGIPFDMNGCRAYVTGNFSSQNEAYDANFAALESNVLSYALWTYVSDNTNLHGDGWNGEDLSIYSLDSREDGTAKRRSSSVWHTSMRGRMLDLDKGGRALPALLRPLPERTARRGTPLHIAFDYRRAGFVYRFLTDRRPSVGVGPTPAAGSDEPGSQTEIWLPDLHYPYEDREDWSRNISTCCGHWKIERRKMEGCHPDFERFIEKTYLVWTIEYKESKETHGISIGPRRRGLFSCGRRKHHR